MDVAKGMYIIQADEICKISKEICCIFLQIKLRKLQRQIKN